MDAPAWTFVAKVEDLPPDRFVVVAAGTTPVLVANVGGEIYAVRDQCTHQGVKLSGGCLRGRTIQCPKHAWRYDLKTGEYIENPKLHVRTYEVKVEDGQVFVHVPYEGYFA